MAFELKANESVGEAVKRIARHQLQGALGQLKSRLLRDEAVHEARKHFKRLRALLRLVRSELGDEIYRRENSCFRDAGQPLTEVRDARVLLDTLEQLSTSVTGKVPPKAFEPVRKALEKHRRAVRKRVLQEQDAVTRVRAAAEEACERLDSWPIEHDGWAAIKDGLQDVYKKGCRSFAAALADPTVEVLHEWRKQSKYLWHQIQILEPLWPELLEKLADEVHRLTQILGDDHDLAVLRQTVLADPDAFGGDRTLEVLLALADRRREEVQQQAFSLGKRIYEDNPRGFADRIHGYWKAWRSEGDATAAEAGKSGQT
jgi:CHAD domain-containing protein